MPPGNRGAILQIDSTVITAMNASVTTILSDGERRGADVAQLHSVTSVGREDGWLVFRFYASMLAVVAVDSCLAFIYGVPFNRFAPTALLLVLLTLLGAYVIFRPIRAYIASARGSIPPIRRIATLGQVSTIYMTIVIILVAIAKFFVLPSVLGFDIDSLLTRNEQLWLPVLHTLYYSALIYFVMIDYEAVLRAHIFRQRGKLVPAARGHILIRLLVAFGVMSVLPMSLVVLHVFERDITWEHHLLIEDIFASTLGLCVTLIFVARSLVGPIRSLENAVASVRRNDLSVTVPVLSNDETGQLASSFNRMVHGLRERALIRQTFGRYIPPACRVYDPFERKRYQAAIIYGHDSLCRHRRVHLDSGKNFAGTSRRYAERVFLGGCRDHREEQWRRYAVPGRCHAGDIQSSGR